MGSGATSSGSMPCCPGPSGRPRPLPRSLQRPRRPIGTALRLLAPHQQAGCPRRDFADPTSHLLLSCSTALSLTTTTTHNSDSQTARQRQPLTTITCRTLRHRHANAHRRLKSRLLGPACPWGGLSLSIASLTRSPQHPLPQQPHASRHTPPLFLSCPHPSFPCQSLCHRRSLLSF